MSGSPVEEDVPPEEAFAALADPTRVGILRALWETDDRTATFSELRRAVGTEDSGRFNYHLSELRGRFVDKTDDGYCLRLAGERIVGALLSGAYTQAGSAEPVTSDQPCPVCDGGPLRFEYEDERVAANCDECGQDLVSVPVPPGVFASYDHGKLPDVTERYTRNILRQFRAGFCATCEGRVRPRVAVETPPDAEDLPRLLIARYECERCGNTISSDLGTAFLDHPGVVAFYHDHGIDVRETTFWRFLAADEDSAWIDGEDPLRASVAYDADGDRLTLTVDGDLTVLATEQD